jgi:2-oxoglutarate dehydrogenase E1 component
LVIFTPKSLLRHPKCVSTIQEFAEGHFQEVYDDVAASAKATKVVLCSGKVYYDLLAEREKEGDGDIAIIRLEQLYPLPFQQLETLKKKYAKASWVWVQEEPENMGALTYLMRALRDFNIQYISRPESASPATGAHHAHDRELRELMNKVFEKQPA